MCYHGAGVLRSPEGRTEAESCQSSPMAMGSRCYFPAVAVALSLVQDVNNSSPSSRGCSCRSSGVRARVSAVCNCRV